MLKQPFFNLDGIENNFISLYGENSLNQKDRYTCAFNKFKQIYGYDSAYIASSSGRVEVLGNHTDHNGGSVVSCAISLDTLAFFMPNDSGIIKVLSEGYPEMVIDTNNFNSTVEKGTSSSLIQGVVAGFVEKGYGVGGFDAYVVSNVLGGAGISSSASFELLISEILNFLFNDCKISQEEKAKISQFAENVYFGKPCGLLDQTAISFGGLNKIDFSNCEKINVTKINDDLKDWTLVLINTGGSHANLTDEYASIPAEMKSVAKAFGKERLIEIDKDYFFENVISKCDNLSDRAIVRAVHFFNENERVKKTVEYLNNKDYTGFIKMIKESGVSSWCMLQNCYVGGSTEQLIPKALALSSAQIGKGANRVHGGGFAGTILNIVANDELEQFLDAVIKLFGNKNIIPLKVRSVGAIVL